MELATISKDLMVSVTNIILLSVAACIVYYSIKLVFYVRFLRTHFKGCPGPKYHWLYGNFHLIPKGSTEERLQFGLSLVQKYRRFYVFWMGPLRPAVNVCHPEIIKKIMKTSGLLISSGQKWARSRRLLTPAFHFDILKPYINVYNESASILCNNLSQYADLNEKFEVFCNVSKLTLDIILRCAFSYQTDCQQSGSTTAALLLLKTHPYVKAVEQLSESSTNRARKPWLYIDWIFYLTKAGRLFYKNCDFVHKVAEDIIEQRKKALEKSGQSNIPSDRKYLDFLDVLLTARDENGQGLTPIEIRNEVDTFLFEGHDTTASALSWILYALAKHPEYQRKCQEEIDTILDGRDTDDILWADLSQFDYLTMCIKEGLRLYSPVPFIQRMFTHDFEVDGKVFPAGTTVSLHLYGLHHNNHLWDKPMEYIPERFTKENVSRMDNFQFLPFSAGPRNCIGQNFAMNEEKVVLATLLRRFWFELDTTHEVKLKVAAVMRSEKGIYMYAKHRKPAATT